MNAININKEVSLSEVANDTCFYLGGIKRLYTMAGATNFTVLKSGLQFDFRICPTFNRVQLLLRVDGKYDVAFLNMVDEVATARKEIHAMPYDKLAACFENETGLFLRWE